MNPFRSLLGTLNFLVLQWLCVRLASSGRMDHETHRFVHERWVVLRWIVPMTGWWSDYVYLRRPR